MLRQHLFRKSIFNKHVSMQQRSMFIQFFDTPNSAAVKFIPGEKVMPNSNTLEISSPLDAYKSPLAKGLFKIDGVKSVFLASDFLTITIDEDKTNWSTVKPFIFQTITTHYQSGRPVVVEDAKPNTDTQAAPQDDEVVIAIKELLETKVRPMVQDDGGDIVFIKFEEGVVYLQLQGSCTTCSSSSATLKLGIENMLCHYIPEVNEVRQWKSETEQISDQEFEKVEKKE